MSEDRWKNIQQKVFRIFIIVGVIVTILFNVLVYGGTYVYFMFGEGAFIIYIVAIIIVSIIIIGNYASKLLKKRKINKGIKVESIRVRKEQVEKEKTLEIEAVEKVKEILKTSASKRIKIDVIKDAIGRDTTIFDEHIWDWAYEFGFKIDGDYILVENADIDGFIRKLDMQFEIWKNRKKN